jgi:hypothetical protein
VIYADNRVRTGLFTETERNLLARLRQSGAVAIEECPPVRIHPTNSPGSDGIKESDG